MSNKIAALLVACAAAAAQAQPKATEDYERAQAARRIAGETLKSEGPARARDVLKAALRDLDRPEVHERAEGNVYLYFRRYDILMDLAGIQAGMEDYDGAIDSIEAATRMAWMPQVLARRFEGEEFAKLRADARFRALVERTEIPSRILASATLATPYSEKIPVEQRVAGLSLFWSEARHAFVHFDNVPDIDWDAVYLKYLPRVIQAESTADYYRVLMEVAPLLHDGHTNVYAPKELQSRFYARPPIQTEMVEGKVLVTLVRSESLARRVRVGDEIVAIDGEPVVKYAESRVMPYVSASTPQDTRLRTYGYELLMGDGTRPLRLTLAGADGARREETVAREGYTDVASPPLFDFRMLPGDVAYFSLDHFENDAGVKAFEAVMPKIAGARALVLDLRRNGGGSTRFGNDILTYLTDKPLPQSSSLVRNETGLDRTQGAKILWRPAAPPSKPYQRELPARFGGPVVVLTSARTFSAAEDFLVAFRTLGRGTVVGEATGGSTGQPLFFKLPGGGFARVCVKRDTFPDGKKFVGVGIVPDVAVRPTVADFRAGRDTVLEAALKSVR